MCGITAILNRDKRNRSQLLHNALKTLELRGPDEHGIWEDQHVSIGHRRLSVMGLSLIHI